MFSGSAFGHSWSKRRREHQDSDDSVSSNSSVECFLDPHKSALPSMLQGFTSVLTPAQIAERAGPVSMPLAQVFPGALDQMVDGGEHSPLGEQVELPGSAWQLESPGGSRRVSSNGTSDSLLDMEVIDHISFTLAPEFCRAHLHVETDMYANWATDKDGNNQWCACRIGLVLKPLNPCRIMVPFVELPTQSIDSGFESGANDMPHYVESFPLGAINTLPFAAVAATWNRSPSEESVTEDPLSDSELFVAVRPSIRAPSIVVVGTAQIPESGVVLPAAITFSEPPVKQDFSEANIPLMSECVTTSLFRVRPPSRQHPGVLKKRARSRQDYGLARNEDKALVLAANKAGTATRVGLGDDLELLLLNGIPDNSCIQIERLKKCHEIRRILAIISPAMAGRVTGMSHDEAAALRNDYSDPLAGVIAPLLAATSVSKLQQGRLACLALHDFALDRGLFLVDFECSVGFLLAFLASQKAASSAASRRLGLIWAQDILKVSIMATSPVLERFKTGNATGSRTVRGSALVSPLILMCHFPKIAANSEHSEYVCAAGAGFNLMIAGSLRYSDVCRNTCVPSMGVGKGQGGGLAIEGCSKGTKGKAGLMYWWAEALDVHDSKKWFQALLVPLEDLVPAPDFIFRRGVFAAGKEGQPEHFLEWGDGPAPKAHIIMLFVYICGLKPLCWTEAFALKFARLHGFRRVYPCIARLLSKRLKLTIDDRQELGRWAASALAGDGKQVVAPLANLYGSDAARFKLVTTRKRVGAAVRDVVRSLGNKWPDLPTEGGGFEVLLSDDPTIQEDEPFWADSDDSDDDTILSSNGSSLRLP